MNEIFTRVQPQNIDAEMLVIGAMMLDGEKLSVAIENLKADDFYRDAHKLLFSIISEINESGSNADLVTVAEKLKQGNKLEQVGGPAYLAELTNCIPLPIDSHCKIIYELSQKRKIISAYSEIIGKAYENISLAELQDDINNAALRIWQNDKTAPVPIAEIMPIVFDEIDQRCKNKNNLPGMSTGLVDLDARLNGLQKSNYVVIAGRPGMGKTSLALKIAETVSREEGVLIFSMEMRNTRLVERLLCMGGGVNSAKVRTGRLHDDDWSKLTRAAGKLSESNLIIDHSAGLTIAELTAKAKRVAMSHNIGLIIVDYVQLMRGSGRTNNRALEVSEISAGLLALAKDLNVCMIALSQLNRLAEGRSDKRPMVSDLKESGSLEQDPDVVLLLYRDEIYNDSPDNPLRGIAEIIIGKGRDIGNWTVKVGFCGERTEFRNLSRVV